MSDMKSFNRAEFIERLRKEAAMKMVHEKSRAQEVIAVRAKFAREREERRKILEEAQKAEKLRQEQEDERRKEEAIENEIKSKTKKYFVLNQFNQPKSPKGSPTYSGQYTGSHGYWQPHGEGEFRINDEVVYKGTFDKKGFLQGNGAHEFTREGEGGQKKWSRWEGGFQNGMMNGLGTLISTSATVAAADGGKQPASATATSSTIAREALARDNVIVCFRDELVEGRQVQFEGTGVAVGLDTERPRATIVKHIRNWRFKVRFHDEGEEASETNGSNIGVEIFLLH
jgi:hypothetical protein